MSKLYRYEDTAGVIRLDQFDVVRDTPRGKVINVWGKEKFVRNDARKRFAYETKDAALIAYRFRKQRQITILSAQLRTANAAYLAVEDESSGTLPDYVELHDGNHWFDV